MISAISPSDHRDLPHTHMPSIANNSASSSSSTSLTVPAPTGPQSSSSLAPPSTSSGLPNASTDTAILGSSGPPSFGSMHKPASHNSDAKTAAPLTTTTTTTSATSASKDENSLNTSVSVDQTSAATPRAYLSGRLVSDHHQITRDHSHSGKMSTSDDDSSSDSMSEKLTDTAISSIHEEFDNIANLNDKNAQATFRPTSAIPTMSLLYSDTAPRSAWRPQLESWLKKHHPSQLREVERATSPPPVLNSLQSHWSFTAVNAQHSAQIQEIKRQSINHRRTLSTDSGDTDLIIRFSESAIAEEEDDVIASSPPKKQPHHVRKSSSHSGLRRKSYGSRDLKPYSRTPPSPTVHSAAADEPRPRPRPRSQSNSVLTSHRPGLFISSADQHAAVGAQKGRSPSFTHQPDLLSTNYQTPISPPSSPNARPTSGSFSHSAGGSAAYFSKRRCISCGSDQSPCWRPSWSASAGQLCNSCGLRYKKTNARCLTKGCGRIPAKGEWVSMKNLATKDPATGLLQYKCLYCNGDVEVGEKH